VLFRSLYLKDENGFTPLDLLKMACLKNRGSFTSHMYTWGGGYQLARLSFGDSKLKVPKRRRGGFEGEELVDVACCESHSALLTASGKLFLWGRVCGIGNASSTGKFDFLPVKVAEGVDSFAISENVSVFLRDGRLFVFGEDVKKNGILGLGDEIFCTMAPQPIGLFDVKQVVLGSDHMVILMEDGAVFTCGCGEGGALGHFESKENSLVPRPVALDCVVVRVAASENVTAVLTNKSSVFIWGGGESGHKKRVKIRKHSASICDMKIISDHVLLLLTTWHDVVFYDLSERFVSFFSSLLFSHVVGFFFLGKRAEG